MERRLQVASFFSGIGGFDLGFEMAGMAVVMQCEIDPFCRKVLKKHWPDVPLYGDIAEIKSEQIPDVDVYVAGFPCQDLSLANQGKRKGLEGKRSGLFHEFIRLVEERQPRWIVLENVPGLLNSNSGRDFAVVLNTLDGGGYRVSWRVFDSKFFGTPQRRRRVFLVGSLGTIGSEERFFLTTDHLQSLLDRASARNKPLPMELEKAIKNQISILSSMPQLEESIQQARSQKDFVMTEKLGRLIQEVAQMLSVRRMTPSEYEKLQGFPVGWTLVDSES